MTTKLLLLSILAGSCYALTCYYGVQPDGMDLELLKTKRDKVCVISQSTVDGAVVVRHFGMIENILPEKPASGTCGSSMSNDGEINCYCYENECNTLEFAQKMLNPKN